MITALIPARGGSKRIPLKNIRTVGGKALIDWSIDLALKSPLIGKTIVSTDSNEIVANSIYLSDHLVIFQNSNYGSLIDIGSGLVIHKRSNDSAKDHSKTFSIVEELFQIPKSISEELILLQPTSPFRSLKEVVDIIEIKERTNSQSVFSVKKVESPHPSKCFQIDEKCQIFSIEQILTNLKTPEQELPTFYAPDGAFYFVSRDFLEREKSFVNLDSICFVRSGPKTINIDNELDLSFAQYLSERDALFL